MGYLIDEDTREERLSFTKPFLRFAKKCLVFETLKLQISQKYDFQASIF